jgi:hypothetical protein
MDDETKNWHDEPRCWIGINRKTRALVAVHCSIEEPSLDQLKGLVKYVSRFKKRSRDRYSEDNELYVATRTPVLGRTEREVGSELLQFIDEKSLMDGLIDWSDYFAHIVRKVEQDTLPDSDLTIDNIYVESQFLRENDGAPQVGLERYIRDWLCEPGQRQLALLGEYGQGKSTASLMTAYHLIKDQIPGDRIPVIIELRGKSLRNLAPEELIAGWAYAYHISPRAVMQLLIAGKLFLIFEGFDEMALVGDSV